MRGTLHVDGIVRANGLQRSMHIVILAWLFVTFTMALTMDSVLAGIAFFVVPGLGPVLLYAAIAVRRLRARREARDTVTTIARRGESAGSINAPWRDQRPR